MNDGYWQALHPKMRLQGHLQWIALPVEQRVRYSWQVRKIVWTTPRHICIAKVARADADVVPLFLIWRLWKELGESYATTN